MQRWQNILSPVVLILGKCMYTIKIENKLTRCFCLINNIFKLLNNNMHLYLADFITALISSVDVWRVIATVRYDAFAVSSKKSINHSIIIFFLPFMIKIRLIIRSIPSNFIFTSIRTIIPTVKHQSLNLIS